MKRHIMEGVDFTLTQPVMRITDPYYSKDTWCTATAENCVTGTWKTKVSYINHIEHLEHINKDLVFTTIKALFACHENIDDIDVFSNLTAYEDRIHYTGPWSILSNDIGVDSGLVCIVDDSRYPENPEDCDSEDKSENQWLDWCCQAIDNNCIFLPSGVISCTADGDGIYPVLQHKNSDGKIDALAIFFTPDIEEELEETND